MLHQSTLPKTLWGEALHFAVWLKNWTSTRALGSDTTPFEKLMGDKPNLSGVPEWGQTIWVHSGTGTKLDARRIEARWVGYDPKSPHAHHVYWLHKNSVSVEQDIKFTSPTFTISSGPPCIITPSQALMLQAWSPYPLQPLQLQQTPPEYLPMPAIPYTPTAVTHGQSPAIPGAMPESSLQTCEATPQ